MVGILFTDEEFIDIDMLEAVFLEILLEEFREQFAEFS